MTDYTLLIDVDKYGEIIEHLHPEGIRPCEEAAFLFCKVSQDGDANKLLVSEIELLQPSAFGSRSEIYLELADNTRASLIKRAHDLGTCLVEVHSHPQQVAAEFSWSDLRGFDEFVPHVRWRLKELPYVAVVSAVESFDSLVWDGDTQPSGTCQLNVNGTFKQPTGTTFNSLRVTT